MRCRRSRRRPYLLVEVLVALSLVALCMVPLLRPHILAMRGEIAVAQRVELERLSELALADVKEQLYEHQYSWSAKNAPPQVIDLGTMEANPLPGRHMKYHAVATLSIATDPEGGRLAADPKAVERRVLEVSIAFIPEGKNVEQVRFNTLVLAERMKFVDNPVVEGPT